MLSSNINPVRSRGQLKQITGLEWQELESLVKNKDRYYRPRLDIVIKPNGIEKTRFIARPFGKLKRIQARIHKHILAPNSKYLPTGMKGSIPNRGHVSGARLHTDTDVVVTLDIKKCFPSTGNHMAHKALIKHLGLGREAAMMITELSTRNDKIPQGAPTSSLLLNYVLIDLFLAAENICNKSKVTLSLVVDDFAISGDGKKVREVISPIVLLIQSYGFKVRSNKTKVMSRSKVQIINGVKVNKKTRAPKKYVEAVRKEIIEVAKAGITDKAALASIKGKIKYIKSLNEKDGNRVRELLIKLLKIDI